MNTLKIRLLLYCIKHTLFLRYIICISSFLPLSLYAVVIPDDPAFRGQWWLHNEGTFTMGGLFSTRADNDIDMIEGWSISTGDSSIIMAIIDSGLRTSHKAFKGRLWKNPHEIPDNGIDDDENGYIDDINGWNFASDNNEIDDVYGHGTMVAGVAAANGNDKEGIAGIDWQCKLMVLKLGDEIPFLSSCMAKAIYYAVHNGARVINISLGATEPDAEEEAAIRFAYESGVIICAGTGNTGDSAMIYPARYKQVIAVGSVDPDGSRSKSFVSGGAGSCFGNEIDVVAPGNFIYTLNNVEDTFCYNYSGGTSIATPVVSGIATLILSKRGDLDPATVIQIITGTATDSIGPQSEDSPGWDQFYGFGMVNAAKALKEVMNASVKWPFKRKRIQLVSRPILLSQYNALVPTGFPYCLLNGRIVYPRNRSNNLSNSMVLPPWRICIPIRTDDFHENQ